MPDLHIAAIFEIAGNVIQQAGFINDREVAFHIQFTMSGTSLNVVDICPGNGSGVVLVQRDSDDPQHLRHRPDGTLE